MIHVLIRGRNCEKYITDCLSSINRQALPCKVFVVLDAPEDNSVKLVKQAAKQFATEIKYTVRKNRLGLGFNMVNGISELDEAFILEPDDIIAIVDADDTLHPWAFSWVNNMYERHPETLVTHGSYIKKTKGRTTRISRAYPNRVDFRKHPWRGSHLKTFKWKLAKHIESNWFWHKGQYCEAASDLALMIPLMELAGRDRVKFIKRPIYIWNDSYSGSTNPRKQKKWEKIIRAKKPLRRLGEDI